MYSRTLYRSQNYKELHACVFVLNMVFGQQVTAAKRPKNSALEVDLDFEHNVRPPPVITEEVTASLEDMIKKRILEVSYLCHRLTTIFVYLHLKCRVHTLNFDFNIF